MTNVLVEGGTAAVLGGFLDAGAIDEVHVFIAPRLAGGARALSPVAGCGMDTIRDAFQLSLDRIERIGGDIYWHGCKKRR